VELVLPKAIRLEPLPDNPSRVAIMWGPLVLAGDLGPVPPRAGRGSGAAAQTPALAPPPAPPTVPVLVTPERSASKWLTPVAARPGAFTTTGIGRDRDVEFVPFYRLHRRVYGAYGDLLTPDQWQVRSTAIRAAQESQRKLEAATIAFAHPIVLVVTYNRDERQRLTFEILVDGTKVGEQVIERRSPQEKTGFFDVEYRVPTGLIQGKQKVTVRFQGTEGSEVGAAYGIRMIRGSSTSRVISLIVWRKPSLANRRCAASFCDAVHSTMRGTPRSASQRAAASTRAFATPPPRASSST
jgi:hypothetical protein